MKQEKIIQIVSPAVVILTLVGFFMPILNRINDKLDKHTTAIVVLEETNKAIIQNVVMIIDTARRVESSRLNAVETNTENIKKSVQVLIKESRMSEERIMWHIVITNHLVHGVVMDGH